MQNSRVSPAMRARRSVDKSFPGWFRIENAHVDEDSSDDETTKVYIYDTIGDSWWGDATPASEFIKQIAAIKTRNIELHLNSPGGDIFDGVAIYNALKAHNSNITVIVDALAASAASFIAQAGDEVIMTKAATMMIHDGSGLVWGDAADMRKTADLLDQLSNSIAEIYSDRAGQSVEFWRDLMIEETWYNSHEAVKSGLADRIGEDTKKEDDEAAQNKWDLSIFNYAGRGAAPDPLQVRQRIANRLKEKTVGLKPQNTSETPEEEPEGQAVEGVPETVNPESPQVNPEVETTEGEAEEVQEERQADQPASPEVPEPTDPSSVYKGLKTMQGQPVTQSYVDGLEAFRNDTIKAAKVDFVRQLATDNKILAPQVDKLTAYALKLDDEQYTDWKDTWEGAASNSMLSDGHGGSGVTNPDGASGETVTQLDTAKGIVRQHKLGGMSNEQIMQTLSYKRVMELDPEYKL